jgi:hypothetical protein
MRIKRLALLFISGLLLAACSHAKVENVQSYLGPPLSRPDRVLVSYFAIEPEQVRLDQGVGARIMRGAGDQSLSALELRAAQDTQATLAEGIVKQLRKYGLPADLAANDPGLGNIMLVQGQIVGIDQGNRTRRTLIGLGAGRSSVSADTQVYYTVAAGPPRFMMAFEGEADSGRMPGAAETMGAGAVAQRAATSAALTGATHVGLETRRATDTAEASKLADAIALRVAQFAVSQGWISQSALKS